MDQLVEALYEQVKGLGFEELIIDGGDKVKSLWIVAKKIRENEPEDALKLLAMLGEKSLAFPPTWREMTKTILGDTIDMVERLNGKDFIFAVKLAEMHREGGNYVAAAHYYRTAANILGREGISFVPGTYSPGSDAATLRLQYLREAMAWFHLAGKSQAASDCYVESMHLQMKRANGTKRLSLKLGWLLSGWGERPSHVVLSGFVLISIYAVAYMFSGIKPSGNSLLDQTVNCLYFSVITFATVGYGDILPDSNFSKLLAASEGLLGIFFTGLFLVTFVKRSTR